MKKIRLFPLLLALCLLLTGLAPSAYALEEPQLGAQAAILVDLNSGDILYAKNIDEQRSPASLTKVMTALLALEAVDRGELSLDDMITAGPDCQTGLDSDSSNASIVSGEQMTLRDYLYCALVASANEACNVIAAAVSGSIGAFVESMNARAAELGCRNTHFSDPNGLSNENHYSTAYDLYLITSAALKHPEFETMVNTVTYHIEPTNANGERNLANSNALLSEGGFYGPGYVYEGAAGVKTGYTRLAGYCLISTAERSGIRALAVVLGSSGPNLEATTTVGNFADTRTLYNWLFDNFSYRQVLSAADPIERVTIDKAEGDGVAILRTVGDVQLLLPNDVDPADRQMRVVLHEDQLVAPIAAGTALGEAYLTIGGKEYGPIRLVTNADIDMARLQFLRQGVQDILAQRWVKTVIIVLAVLLALYLLLVARYRALRRRHLRQRKQAEKRRRALQQQREEERRMREARDRQPEEPTQRFAILDPSERDAGGMDFGRYFDEPDKK